MPNYWLKIDLNTPDRLKPLINKPGELKREVYKTAAEHGGFVEHFYLDDTKSAAYALVQHRGDPAPLFDALEARPAETLLRLEEID